MKDANALPVNWKLCAAHTVYCRLLRTGKRLYAVTVAYLPAPIVIHFGLSVICKS